MEQLPRMPEPRITISSNPTTYLQRFEFPLNGQTFNAIGITVSVINATNTDINDIVQKHFDSTMGLRRRQSLVMGAFD